MTDHDLLVDVQDRLDCLEADAYKMRVRLDELQAKVDRQQKIIDKQSLYINRVLTGLCGGGKWTMEESKYVLTLPGAR